MAAAERQASGLEREMREHFQEDEMARYEQIHQFFRRHETASCDETHTSLMGPADTFTSTGKWQFPDDDVTQDFLGESLAWLYAHDWMCYISEKQSMGFPFVEDIDVQCRGDLRDAPPDELIMESTGDPGEFMRLRAQCMHQFYPDLPVLLVHVYTASGWHKVQKLWKTSFHLVWPQLIVDADRAPVIRLGTLHEFSKRTKDDESFLSGLFEELDRLDPKNPSARRVTPDMLWEEVFDKTTVQGGNYIRMPYNDKIRRRISAEDQELIHRGELTKADARRRAGWEQEHRPSQAVGTIRFEFNSNGEVSDACWQEDANARSVQEWIRRGSVRRPGSPALTPWCIPAESGCS